MKKLKQLPGALDAFNGIFKFMAEAQVDGGLAHLYAIKLPKQGIAPLKHLDNRIAILQRFKKVVAARMEQAEKDSEYQDN